MDLKSTCPNAVAVEDQEHIYGVDQVLNFNAGKSGIEMT